MFQVVTPMKMVSSKNSGELLTYGGSSNDNDLDVDQTRFIFILYCLFLIAAYFFGFLVSVPLYVYVNMTYFRFGSKKERLLVICLAVLITIISFIVLRIPLNQGVLI
jgi:small-conductance mechanosensitive channel